MKQLKNGNIQLQVLSYINGKYHIKFPNLEVPVVIDEDIYKKWITEGYNSQSNN